MSKLFLVDSSQSRDGKSPCYIFNSIPELVKHLEGTCHRRFGQTRAQYMQNAADLGVGYDDAEGRNFVEQLEQYFMMGVIRGTDTPVRCNVFDASRFSKQKDVHGN